MKARRSALVFAFVTTLGAVCPRALAEPSSRTVVDRVVAVVGDDIVTLVELRRRAKPFLAQIASTVKEAERVAAEAVMYRDLVGKLVEERIVDRFARSQRQTVTPSEIDMACDLVAKANQISLEELYEQAALQGMDRASYRDELARQILRQKVARLVVPSRVYEEHRGGAEAEITKAIDDFMKTWFEQQKREIYVEVRL